MSQLPDSVAISQEPNLDEEQNSSPQQTQQLWISSVSFPETPQLPSQRFQESPKLVSTTLPKNSENFISTSALLTILPPSLHQTLTRHLSSSKSPVSVLLEWRLSSARFPTIKTRHIIINSVSKDITSLPSTDVVFCEPTDWVQAVFDNHKNFLKVQRQIKAAATTTTTTTAAAPIKNRRSRSLQGRNGTNSDNLCFCNNNKNCNHRCSTFTGGGGVGHHRSPKTTSTINATSRGRQQQQQQQQQSLRDGKAQCSKKHLEALGRHAEQHYNETGDTSELRRVMELHRRCGIRSASV
ncbi:hypothetical protein QBC43DRAFT_327828 [Cladorrhinum sp. PSN259]|nr:hypothetical protein QBC43DRAFT_327828 [Cladorrhinum sp. PSN259]